MGPKLRRIVENSVCLTLIVATAILIVSPAFVDGLAPVDMAPLFDKAPWQEAAPDTLPPSVASQAEDPVRKFVPWYLFLHTAGLSNDIYWNPYEATGLPFYGLWRTRCLSPFSLPFYVLQPFAALSVSLVMKLLVAGLCAYYAARRFGFAIPMALFVALSFQLSAPLVFWAAWPLSDTLPWFPLLVIFCERLALGHYRTWALGGLTLAVMLLGGAPEAVAMFLLFGFLVLLFRHWGSASRWAELAGGYATLTAAAAVALVALAVQLVPFVEWYKLAAGTGAAAAMEAPRASDIAAVFFPPVLSLSSGTDIAGSSMVVSLLHVGTVPVWLLLLWLSLRRFAHAGERRRIDPFLIASGLFTLCGLAIYPFVSAWRPFAWLNPEHFLLTNAFVLALAGAATGEEWLQLKADDCADTLKRFGGVLAAGVAGAAALAALNLHDAAWQIETGFGAGLLVALIALIGTTLLYPSVRVLGYGLAVIAFLNLYPLANMNMPWAKREAFFPATDFVASLSETGQRVSGSAKLARWPLAAHFMPQFHASSGAELRRHAQLRSAIDRDPLLTRRTGSAYLLLTREDIQGAFAPIRAHLRIRHVFSSGAVLFEDPEGYPRAWVAYDGQVAETFDPARVAWDAAPVMETVNAVASEVETPGVAAIENPETHTRVTINVDSPAPGTLVFADAWYPGWTCTVNGVITDVFPVDGLYRGVVVPQGESEVVFAYRPANIRRAGLVSLAGLVILAIGAAWLVPGAIRNFRERAAWSWAE